MVINCRINSQNMLNKDAFSILIAIIIIILLLVCFIFNSPSKHGMHPSPTRSEEMLRDRQTVSPTNQFLLIDTIKCTRTTEGKTTKVLLKKQIRIRTPNTILVH